MDIFFMHWKIFICLIMAFFLGGSNVCSYCQEVRVHDSVMVIQKGNFCLSNDRVIFEKGMNVKADTLLFGISRSNKFAFNNGYSYCSEFYANKSFLHKGEYSVSGVIKRYPYGRFYGMGKQINFIGLGQMNYAGIGLYSMNRCSLNIFTYALKWHIPRYESLLFGLFGSLSYSVNEKVNLNTFASYSLIFSSSFRTINYGGFVTYDMHPNWRMDIGVKRCCDFRLRNEQTVPIIAPYFRYKGNKLSVDVGSGLIQLFK